MRATSRSLLLASSLTEISGPMPVMSPSISPSRGSSSRMTVLAVMGQRVHQGGDGGQRLEFAHHGHHLLGLLLRELRELGVLPELVGDLVVSHGHRGAAL